MNNIKKYFALFVFSIFVLCASAGTSLAHCGHDFQKSGDIQTGKNCGDHGHGSADIEFDHLLDEHGVQSPGSLNDNPNSPTDDEPDEDSDENSLKRKGWILI